MTVGNLALREALARRRGAQDPYGDAIIGVTEDVQQAVRVRIPSIVAGDLLVVVVACDANGNVDVDDLSAKAAAHADSRSWSVELRLPAAGENARDSGIAGRKPTETYPWFINVCRQRVRGSEREHSAWSPTGESRTEEPVKFGKVYAR